MNGFVISPRFMHFPAFEARQPHEYELDIRRIASEGSSCESTR